MPEPEPQLIDPAQRRREREERRIAREAAKVAREEAAKAGVVLPHPHQERPPFAPGNTAHITHGAGSERAIAERAKQVLADILPDAPWLDRPEFMPALARYLRAETRAILLHEYFVELAEHHVDGVEAIPQKVLENVTAAERLAAQLAETLGLSPKSKAKIAKDLMGAADKAASLSDFMARGAEARSAAESKMREGAIDVTAIDDDPDSLAV